MSIASLGYIGFKVRDPDAWSAFATGILGLMPAPGPDGSTRFRADARAWRFAVEKGESDDIDFIGLEVAGGAELAAMKVALEAAGVGLKVATTNELKSRGVMGLFSCSDPDGLRVEIYYGASEVREAPFVSPKGVSGFVTGDQGVGHVVITTKDINAARAFYSDLLGFKLSDIIHMQIAPDFGLDLEFYHCNSRHHTLALVPAPAPKRLHHFMLQTESLDDVGFALDRANAAKAVITQTLGKHTNDEMVSFYAQTPAGFEVEFGWGAREVDESWRVVRHDRTSTWGHKRPNN